MKHFKKKLNNNVLHVRVDDITKMNVERAAYLNDVTESTFLRWIIKQYFEDKGVINEKESV